MANKYHHYNQNPRNQKELESSLNPATCTQVITSWHALHGQRHEASLHHLCRNTEYIALLYCTACVSRFTRVCADLRGCNLQNTMISPQ